MRQETFELQIGLVAFLREPAGMTHKEKKPRERLLLGWAGEGTVGVGAGCAGGSGKLKNTDNSKITFWP